ncbi:MAG: acyl-CoA/acyl-ACP dehydrogenase [Acidimicrobiales bacterium]|nr:acyl-CoA/acyl-ACP dehydrogenase [Acidimicrobiales bacterium]
MSEEMTVVPDALLVETLTRLFTQTCGHEVIQQAETDGWAEVVWEPLAATGAPWVGVPESVGGSGGTLADAIAVQRLVGRFAVPLPVAETGLLGGWLAGAAGIALPDGPLTVVPQRPNDRLSIDGGVLNGVAHRVPWAARSSLILALVGDEIIAVEPGAAGVGMDVVRNLAGEPRETVRFDGTPIAHRAAAPAGVDAIALRQRGALCRSAQIAGALERIAELTVEYANQRTQFGQKIARFQAVAQHLVRIASETRLVGMALDGTVAAFGGGDATFEVASLKSLAGESGSDVTTRAHQVHGAIGMTQEFVLHQLSRRVWSWREEFGSTAWWRQGLGQLVADVGADGLWPLVSEGSASLLPA